jgi:L-seryl-tRNA(Ser) seleniumtransferase
VRLHAADGLSAAVARETLADVRGDVRAGSTLPDYDAIVGRVVARLAAEVEPPLRPLINATGVIIHTNLGRAPLAAEAIAAMEVVSQGYSNLEFDVGTGRRGSRHMILEPLLRRVTGAEAGLTVNNNAGAVVLALSALAAGKEVIISRGQLVEIGGGFRIPDVMRQSRAKLVEVGTTNRTRLADYETAITARTAAIMRVHPSNFRIMGFAETPSAADLAALAHDRALLFLDDLGSGCLLDTTAYGLTQEPRPQDSIALGADVVMFSGDKLLGGPQGGLIAGKKDALDRMKRHPLARAVRLDKASIAGLAATLQLYVEGKAPDRVPVWRMIGIPLDEIARRADAMAAAIGPVATVTEGRSMIGGGSLPEESLPTKLVALRPGRGGVTALAAALRIRGLIARVERDSLLLDPRTIAPLDDEQVASICVEALA